MSDEQLTPDQIDSLLSLIEPEGPTATPIAGEAWTQEQVDAVAFPEEPVADQVLGVLCYDCGSAIVTSSDGNGGELWQCCDDDCPAKA